MYEFSQSFTEDNDYSACVHLRDFADELGVDTSWAIGLSEDMEEEQLATLRASIEEEIQAELERLELAKRPACSIGPYAGGICTICGGREPC